MNLEEAALLFMEGHELFKEHEQKGLKKAAEIIQEESKSELGNYQDAVGPLEAWAELADATKEDRVHRGYPENEPLLREGTLRDSINVYKDDDGYTVGSELEQAYYLEVGTEKMPPRSFLEGAFYRKEKEIAEEVGDIIVKMFK